MTTGQVVQERVAGQIATGLLLPLNEKGGHVTHRVLKIDGSRGSALFRSQGCPIGCNQRRSLDRRDRRERSRGKQLAQSMMTQTKDGRRWSVLIRRGMADIGNGFRRHELWTFLGWREVRKQYQRSVIGPFWLTLNMGILVAALGWFYSQIFEQDITTFLPYLAIGFIVWALISGLIIDSCGVFTAAATSVRQSPLPFSIYAYQLVWRHLVVFGHNFFIYVVVAIVFGIKPGLMVLAVVPGLAIICVAGFLLALVLGPIAARFRDIPLITASIVQILFFLTPIIWTPENLPERAYFVMLNPFFHFVAVVREPLLGNAPMLLNWTVCLGLTALLGLFALVFFGRLRARIPYWA